jgi:hypothetical protein
LFFFYQFKKTQQQEKILFTFLVKIIFVNDECVDVCFCLCKKEEKKKERKRKIMCVLCFDWLILGIFFMKRMKRKIME